MLRSREKLHRSQSSLTCARRFTVVLICFPGLAHQNFRDVKSWSARCNALQRPSVKLRGETRTCQACGAENEAEQITACSSCSIPRRLNGVVKSIGRHSPNRIGTCGAPRFCLLQ